VQQLAFLSSNLAVLPAEWQLVCLSVWCDSVKCLRCDISCFGLFGLSFLINIISSRLLPSPICFAFALLPGSFLLSLLPPNNILYGKCQFLALSFATCVFFYFFSRIGSHAFTNDDNDGWMTMGRLIYFFPHQIKGFRSFSVFFLIFLGFVFYHCHFVSAPCFLFYFNFFSGEGWELFLYSGIHIFHS
jgi:hypothetical protein